ncbi:protein phosphatase 2C domain-containing protein [Actinoplanes sp. CA-015351]|uniref:protein phosphatase 2C domain-containing protein n=1 Tax=Actinoplanes sp. CA-015351 TaxID=3239897 RepID=UPI003D9A05D6
MLDDGRISPPEPVEDDTDWSTPLNGDLGEPIAGLHPPDPPDEQLWHRHRDERWVVEDAGRQPLVRPIVAARVRTPPPDIVVDGADAGSITFRAASVRGLSHQERGEPRQDAYAIRFTRDQRWLVGCIADGVSDGPRSHEAAAEIVDKLTGTLIDFLTGFTVEDPRADWQTLADALPWAEAVEAANTAVTERAREYLRRAYARPGSEEKLRELEESLPFAHVRTIMSATALVFMVDTAPSADGTHRALLANLAGDSSAFLLREDAWLPMVAIKNEGNEILSSSVRPMPDLVEPRVDTFHLAVGESFVVMTDGLGDPLGSARGTVGAFLREKWHTPPDVLAFAQHLAFYKKTFTDDRTAVMVWTNPPRRRR